MHPGGRPSSKPRSALGQRLAQAREQAGLSQAQVAEHLGVKQPTVAYWERDAVNLHPDFVAKLTQLLSITTDELLGTKPPRSRAAKPIGKARQLFDAVSKLPRRQQEKVFDILEPFVREHINDEAKSTL